MAPVAGERASESPIKPSGIQETPVSHCHHANLHRQSLTSKYYFWWESHRQWGGKEEKERRERRGRERERGGKLSADVSGMFEI